jgi:hypothetical protein
MKGFLPRTLARAMAVFCFLLSAAMPVAALELLMFERSGCVWCQRWDKEVSPGYIASLEGRRAPLRRVSLDRGAAGLEPGDKVLVPPVFYTPTFVLMENGRELGRITGYTDNATFWGLLEKILPKVAAPAENLPAENLPPNKPAPRS